MGKFLSRFALGAALGLFAIWLWGQLNQDDDDFDDDDEVIEIPIGDTKPASDATGSATTSARKPASDGPTTHARVATPATAAKSDGNADGAAGNLERVEGIGPAFNGILNEAGIKTDGELAQASVEQLRATGILRSEEEFASWIAQAKQRVGRK